MANAQGTVQALYKKLIHLYPRAFRERLGESMQQTFDDLQRERRTEPGGFGFIGWIFVETALSIIQEHILSMTEGEMMKDSLAIPRFTALVSSILLVVAFIVGPLIYLMGNLRDTFGPLSYDVADFLSGPVWAASLVSMVFLLRERIGERAPRRMSLALLATVLAAGLAVVVALIRSSNRHYHLLYPELHLENSSDVLIVWTTLVAGLANASWHFLGWALVLIGSAGWTSRSLPRLLSALYLVTGVLSMFVYLFPGSDGNAGVLSVVVMIWQGILLWRTGPEGTQSPGINTSQLDHA